MAVDTASFPSEHMVIDQFVADMRSNGLEFVQPIIADGVIHRYDVVGDTHHSWNGYAILHIDAHPAGMYATWKDPDGRKFKWSMKGTWNVSAEERRAEIAKHKARAEQRAIDDARDHAAAAVRAKAIYEAARPVALNPYLASKGVQSHPVTRIGDWPWENENNSGVIKDALIVPILDFAKKIHSLQGIFPDRQKPGKYKKLFLKDGDYAGYWVVLGRPVDNILILCEGLVTGLSIHQCTGHCVIVCFTASNLKAVAQRWREQKGYGLAEDREPVDYRIVICADNDQWPTEDEVKHKRKHKNSGLLGAEAAAAEVGGIVVYPEFRVIDTRPTDFNDLQQLEGETVVRTVIDRALAPETAAPAVDEWRSTEADQIDASALISHPPEATPVEVTAHDFWVFLPQHKYLFVPTGELWPKASVNARVLPLLSIDGKKVSPTDWVDEQQRIDQFTWAPGEPTLICDRLVSGEDWIWRDGCTCFNRYRPPNIKNRPNVIDVSPWLQHIERVYGEHAGHIIRWLAHRVQRPGEKINHALMLGGKQSIGKDTLLEPVKYSVGSDNFVEIAPKDLTGNFNGYLKSVVLRVSEAHDLGEFDRYSFYERMKTLTAAPPNVLRCNEKYVTEYTVQNVCGVILTTNYKETGIYLPAEDRRHYVAWSELSKEDFTDGYFRELYAWFAAGGNDHVAAYLARFDLTGFDPKAPPPKTQAFHDIVSANASPENADMADLLDRLNRPDAVTLATLILHADGRFKEWLEERKHRRHIPQRLQPIGYAPIRNENAKDGMWKVMNARCAIYARTDLSVQNRMIAAGKICGAEEF